MTTNCYHYYWHHTTTTIVMMMMLMRMKVALQYHTDKMLLMTPYFKMDVTSVQLNINKTDIWNQLKSICLIQIHPVKTPKNVIKWKSVWVYHAMYWKPFTLLKKPTLATNCQYAKLEIIMYWRRLFRTYTGWLPLSELTVSRVYPAFHVTFWTAKMLTLILIAQTSSRSLIAKQQN